MSGSRHQRILDHGFVTLEEVMGDDLTIVNAARQSYNKKSGRLDEADIGLIEYLIKNRHGSPLELVVFRFTVKLPISVAREWLRHRMSSFNERSGRYTKLEPEFYIPETFREQIGKKGNYSYRDMEDEDLNDR
jgi:thymidylate synthase (FAD)